MQPSDEHWARIWRSRDGQVWNVLTEAVFKQFAVEQLAVNWVAGRAVTA
jgi:hypothetical protein